MSPLVSLVGQVTEFITVAKRRTVVWDLKNTSIPGKTAAEIGEMIMSWTMRLSNFHFNFSGNSRVFQVPGQVQGFVAVKNQFD